MERQIITRAEARARGLKRYFTGKACKRGHMEERSVRGDCLGCDRERRQKYYEENREAELERNRNYKRENRKALLERKRKYYQENREAELERCRKYREENRGAELERKRKYYEAHREALLEYGRKWREENRKAVLECQKKYREENPEVRAADRARYRARKLGAACPTANKAAIRALIAERKHLSEFLGVTLHLDHYIPLTKGGKDHEDNLWFLPASVNISKGNKIPGEEWELPRNEFEQVTYRTVRSSRHSMPR